MSHPLDTLIVSELFDSTEAVIVVLDAEGHVVDFNTAAEEVSGYYRDEIKGQHFTIFLGREDSEKMSKVFRSIQEGSELLRMTLDWVGKEGRKHTIRWRNAIVRDNDGTLKYVISSGVRLDNVISSLEEKQSTERYYHTLFREIPLGLVRTDMQGNVLEANEAFCQIIGYSMLDACKLSLTGITPGKYAASDRDQSSLLGLTDSYGPYEKEFTHRDGHLVPVRLNGKKIQRDGKDCVWSSVENITELRKIRTRMEDLLESKSEELEVSLLRAKSILNTVLDGIITIDQTGMVLDMNPAAEKIFQFSAEEVTGQNVRMLMPAEIAAQHDGYLANYHKTGVAKIIGIGREVTGLRKNGEQFPLHLAVSQMKSSDQTLYIGSVRDISEAKENEKALMQAKEIAEKANVAKTDFLSRMSHELRTPLNAVLGFSQLLDMDENIHPKAKEQIAEISKAGEHLLQLINEVLDLAGVEAGKISFSIEPIPLNELIADVTTLMSPIAERKQISISQTIKGIELAVRADMTRVRQVLINLVSNAIKYNRVGGEIEIICSAREDVVEISVNDTGIGIPEEKLGQLFSPFDRLGAENTDVEGTGIGLVISKRLIEMMGGSLNVESHIGKGSAFSILLPRCRVMTHSAAEDSQEETVSDTGKKLIVYIEDNPVNLKLVEAMLESRPNYHLVAAADPEFGIELIKQREPDLILLDINLPRMSGFDVLKILEADGIKAVTPVIAITANAMPSDVRKGRKAGFDAYLKKPLNFKEFISVIDTYLQS